MISSKWFSVSSLRIPYSVFCSYPLPQLLPDSPSLHTQLCVLFFSVSRVKLHGPYIPGCVVFHWSEADSPGANHERKTGSSSPRTYQLPQRLMELGADFLSPWWCFLFIFFPGWDLNRSCVCCHNCCEFIRAVPCCVLKILSPCSHPPPLALTLFPPSLPQYALSFGRRAYGTDVTFRADYSEVSESLASCYLLQ